jgi:hypothetical protein
VQPHSPFNYALIDEESPTPTQADRNREVVHKFAIFIKERIIARHQNKLPLARTIAVRLIIFQELIDPSGRSLQSYATELGCSRAWLSKVGIQFADSIGMRAVWQRINSRETYAERATGVHAGTWKASAKWERRKLRAKRKQGTAVSSPGKESFSSAA